MEFREVISTRRSVRKYSEREVEQQLIDELLEMTLKAPSSRNSHSTHFVVIRNTEIIKRIATMRDYGSAFVKGAPVFILILGDTAATDLWQVNCAISATVMQLAATSLGLSSCWVHIEGRPQLQAEPAGAMAEEIVRELVEIPESYGILCGIALGHSDFEPAPLPEFDGASRVRVL